MITEETVRAVRAIPNRMSLSYVSLIDKYTHIQPVSTTELEKLRKGSMHDVIEIPDPPYVLCNVSISTERGMPVSRLTYIPTFRIEGSVDRNSIRIDRASAVWDEMVLCSILDRGNVIVTPDSIGYQYGLDIFAEVREMDGAYYLLIAMTDIVLAPDMIDRGTYIELFATDNNRRLVDSYLSGNQSKVVGTNHVTFSEMLYLYKGVFRIDESVELNNSNDLLVWSKLVSCVQRISDIM